MNFVKWAVATWFEMFGLSFALALGFIAIFFIAINPLILGGVIIAVSLGWLLTPIRSF